MDTAESSLEIISAWQQLKNREITCEEALRLLVDEENNLQLELLDEDLTFRFFRETPEGESMPPVIPLLLWRACYYLASPKELEPEEVQLLEERLHTDVRVISINAQSYRAWFRQQHMPDHSTIVGARVSIDPLTGQFEEQDISEVADFLSQASSQAHRINAIISGALQSRASDIHLEPAQEGLRVRYRIDGIMRNITTLDPEVSRSVVVAIKVMADMDIAESRAPQDGRIGKNYMSGQDMLMDLDLRVSTLPCVGGEKVVIRLLKRERNAYNDISSVGFTKRTLATFQKWLQQPQGLIIITGPTGSGKTSTLYTSLRSVATEHVNVVTVEDPVEYVLENITQTQVNEKAGMTFSAGLRAILRQDPDIIMVGEIRDRQTAETVVRAALTGHLVFTTMHTNDALSTVPRLRDLGPDPGLMSDALLGIVAQRLVRKNCPHCSESYTPTDEDFEVLGLRLGELPTDGWRKGKGCVKCFNSGYLGRTAVVELLDMNPRVRRLIHEGHMTELTRYINKIPFQSFRIAAIDKIVKGETTTEEVRRVLPSNALNPLPNEESPLSQPATYMSMQPATAPNGMMMRTDQQGRPTYYDPATTTSQGYHQGMSRPTTYDPRTTYMGVDPRMTYGQYPQGPGPYPQTVYDGTQLYPQAPSRPTVYDGGKTYMGPHQHQPPHPPSAPTRYDGGTTQIGPGAPPPAASAPTRYDGGTTQIGPGAPPPAASAPTRYDGGTTQIGREDPSAASSPPTIQDGTQLWDNTAAPPPTPDAAITIQDGTQLWDQSSPADAAVTIQDGTQLWDQSSPADAAVTIQDATQLHDAPVAAADSPPIQNGSHLREDTVPSAPDPAVTIQDRTQLWDSSPNSAPDAPAPADKTSNPSQDPLDELDQDKALPATEPAASASMDLPSLAEISLADPSEDHLLELDPQAAEDLVELFNAAAPVAGAHPTQIDGTLLMDPDNTGDLAGRSTQLDK